MVLMTRTESLPTQVIYGVFCEDILEERPRYNDTTQFQPSARIFFIRCQQCFFFFYQNTFTIQDFSTKTKTQFPQSVFQKKKRLVTQLPLMNKNWAGPAKFVTGQVNLSQDK